MDLSQLCQFFSPTTLAAMYVELENTDCGVDIARVNAARVTILTSLLDLVGNESGVLIEAERAKG